MNSIGKKLFLITLSLLHFSTPSWAQSQHQQDPFSLIWSDEIRQVRPGDTFDFAVTFKVPKEHYLYDDKSGVTLENLADFKLIKDHRPPPESHYDEFFKKNLAVHFKNFTQTISLQVPSEASLGQRTLEGEIRYQGCSDDFCYRPVKKKILVPVAVVNEVSSPVAGSGNIVSKAKPDSHILMDSGAKKGFWELIQANDPESLLRQGKFYLLLLALVGGILTSFTPCVLPIIPLTLAFIGARRRSDGKSSNNIIQALWLVLGMVLMYSLLGFAAATLGLKLGFLFQSRYFVLATALFFFIFALGLFGVIPFQLPQSWQQKFTQMGGEGPVGAIVAGLTIGLIASPCVGPLIAPLLLIAARSQDRVYGFFLLLTYGVGMGLLFLLLATGWAGLQKKLKGGAWTKRLKNVMAILLLLPAFWYGYVFAKPYLPKSVDKIWVTNFAQGMSLARETGKPVLLDYYADWCPPCHEMDLRTFSDAEVRALGESSFVMLKIDCTKDDENCQAATAQYEVIGWPTILFLYPDGNLIEGLAWSGGFADKEEMLKRMRTALNKTKRGVE